MIREFIFDAQVLFWRKNRKHTNISASASQKEGEEILFQ